VFEIQEKRFSLNWISIRKKINPWRFLYRHENKNYSQPTKRFDEMPTELTFEPKIKKKEAVLLLEAESKTKKINENFAGKFD
jgi:hypothetical protein